MKKLTELARKIEAILFLENSFISKKELAQKVEIAIDKVDPIITKLNAYYKENGHAFTVLVEENNCLLTVSQKLSIELSHLYKTKQQQKLSKALLETLAVIAYSQPITKPEIDEIRGVNSDSAIKLLKSQNLIKILGKKPIPGSPNQYGTTSNFLTTFGLKSIKDLPKLNELDMQKFDVKKISEKVLSNANDSVNNSANNSNQDNIQDVRVKGAEKLEGADKKNLNAEKSKK